MWKRGFTAKNKKREGRRKHAVPLIFCASKTVSRVLYLTVIYLRAALPRRSSHPGSGRASHCSHTGVAPDRVYSIGHFRADGCALTAPFHLFPQRFAFSNLHQKRHPIEKGGRKRRSCLLFCCKFEKAERAGSLFLLHFSSDRSGRALPVILALWSPDFPHSGPFGHAARLSVLLARLILSHRKGLVNGKSVAIFRALRYTNKLWNFSARKDARL